MVDTLYKETAGQSRQNGMESQLDLSALENLRLEGKGGLLENAAMKMVLEVQTGIVSPDVLEQKFVKGGKFDREGFRQMHDKTCAYLIRKNIGTQREPQSMYQFLCSTFKRELQSSLEDRDVELRTKQFAVFLQEVVPRLVLIAARNREDGQYSNDQLAVIESFSTFTRQIARNGEVKFFSPLCPPYNHKVETNVKGEVTAGSLLSRVDGQLLPHVGNGFEHASNVMNFIFGPLINQQCPVEWTCVHYSGELGVDGFFELDPEVKEYYKAVPQQLVEIMKSAFRDMQARANRVTGVAVAVQSLESFAERIEKNRFLLTQGYREGNYFAQQIIKFFIQKEIERNKKNSVNTEAVFTEAAVYQSLMQFAKERNIPIVGLEATSSYSMGLVQIAGCTFDDEAFELAEQGIIQPTRYPVMMMSPYNPQNRNGSSVRQPWNDPLVVRVVR